MSLPQDAVNQRRSEIGQIIEGVGQALGIGKIVVDALDPLLPLCPALFADVGIYQILLLAAADHTGHAGQSGRVLVLLVDLEPVLLADVIEILHALAVFFGIGSLDLDDCVDTLAAAVDQRRDRELQLSDDRILRAQIGAVGFYQRVAVIGDVVVLDAFTVQRIEANPRTCIGVIVAEYSADIVIRQLVQLAEQFTCGTVNTALLRQRLAVLVLPRFGDVADIFIGVEQRLEVVDDLFLRRPLPR